jgi:ABC-2 type transport system ATP-binding protein
VPERGRVSVMDQVPWADRVRYVRKIGVVFGQRTQLWWDLPVIESFDLLRDIYAVPAERYTRTRDELIESLDLSGFLDTTVRQLSLGQRMRCDLAAALMHEPDLLFLDEPTIGLDAVSKLAVREFIGRLNKDRGVTVILTTHDMDDIEALCRRVVVADPDARLIRQEGRRFCLAFDPQRVSAPDLIGRLVRRYDVHDLFVEDPPIEVVIARLYGRNAAAAEAR